MFDLNYVGCELAAICVIASGIVLAFDLNYVGCELVDRDCDRCCGVVFDLNYVGCEPSVALNGKLLLISRV